jgi:hypothetical protein
MRYSAELSPYMPRPAFTVLLALAAFVPTAFAAETLHDKFFDFAIDGAGPRALLLPAIPAAIRMINPPDTYPRDWRQGPGAFGRQYGAALASQGAQQTARFITGALLHEELRYHPSASHNPLVRTFHAIGFTFVDQSDSGARRPAFANFTGAAAEGFVGNLYLPAGFNNTTHAETRMMISFGTLAGRNIVREFGPEITRVAQTLHIRLHSAIPEWWTPR